MNYQFLQFKLEPQNFKLFKGEEPLDIEPQVFNIIWYLLENRVRVVSREELLDKLWTGKEVLDATISNHIKLARSILGDDGQKQSVIRTIRGRGYQFIAEVAFINEIKDKSSIKEKKKLLIHKSTVLYLLLLIPITYSTYYYISHTLISTSNTNKLQTNSVLSKQSIAILPFQNRSNIEEDIFFTDGFHDDLLTQVSKIDNLKTISRTSVMQYRDTTKNLKVIAKELGVTTVLEGGVQRSGNKIRINIQLIDAINDQHIWASTYTRDLKAKNIFIIQTEISKQISSALKLALAPSFNKLPTQNMNALEYYFRAKAILVKKTSLTNKQAIMFLKKAIKEDSDFGNAYAELAYRYLDRINLDGASRKHQIFLALPLIKKSITLDPLNSYALKIKKELEDLQ